jgi:hypothetical protein
MIPVETEQPWEDYLTAEHVRVQQEALRRWIAFEALLPLPAADWYSWARQLSHGEWRVNDASGWTAIYNFKADGTCERIPGSAKVPDKVATWFQARSQN